VEPSPCVTSDTTSAPREEAEGASSRLERPDGDEASPSPFALAALEGPGPAARIAPDELLARYLRAALVLFLAGASFCLAVAQLYWSAPVAALVGGNAVELRARLVALGASALCGLTVAASAFWLNPAPRGDARHLNRFERASRLASPALVASLIPGLFARGAWDGREVMYLTTVGVVCLLLERCLRPALTEVAQYWTAFAAWLGRLPLAVRGALPLGVVLGFVGYYFVVIGNYTLISHECMATMSSDLAEFDNLFFNALHGHPFRAPAIEGDLDDWSALKVHAEFGLYLLLPFYALSPGPEALLLIQTGLVALTAIPVYLLAARRVGRAAGVVFATVLLLLPIVQRPNFYDFHFTPLGMFLVAWVLYFLDGYLAARRDRSSRRWGIGLALAFGAALLAREDVSIGLAVLGAFVALSGQHVRLGLGMAAISAGYFVIVKFWLMPRFGTMWFDTIYQDLMAPGATGFGAVILTLLSNPVFVLRSLLVEDKLLYVLHMTVPLLALWLRRPFLLLAAVPGFVSTLLVTNRPPMYQSSFQYTYLWVPYVVGASIVAVSQLASTKNAAKRWAWRTAAVVGMGLAATASSFQYGAFFGSKSILGGFGVKAFETSEAERRRLQQLRELVSRIPPSASVAATEAEGPHVSTRLVMYSLKFTLGHAPDYLVVGAVRPGGEQEHLRQALGSGEYGVVHREGPFFLLQRGADTSRNKELWPLLRRSR
jgi:uncharacterized membrane protein